VRYAAAETVATMKASVFPVAASRCRRRGGAEQSIRTGDEIGVHAGDSCTLVAR